MNNFEKYKLLLTLLRKIEGRANVWEVLDSYLKNKILGIPCILRGRVEGNDIKKEVMILEWRDVVKEYLDNSFRYDVNKLEKMWYERFRDDPTAILVIPWCSGVISFDIDAKRDRPYVDRVEKCKLQISKICYLEETPNRGFHVCLVCPRSKWFDIRLRDVLIPFEIKSPLYSTQGLFVYPSRVIDDKKIVIGKYTLLSSKLLHEVENSEEDVEKVLNLILGVKVDYEVISFKPEDLLKVRGNELRRCDVDYKKSDIKPILSKFIDESRIRQVSVDKIIELLNYIANLSNCVGLKYVVEILKDGKWDIPYEIYSDLVVKSVPELSTFIRHCRSTWTIIEYDLARVLFDLGIPYEKSLEIAQILEERQGEDPANTSPVRTFTQAYNDRYWGLDRQGLCVFRVLGICNKEYCNYTMYTLARETIIMNFYRVLSYMKINRIG